MPAKVVIIALYNDLPEPLLIMSDLPHCPECQSEFTYEDRGQFVCPECAHEWADASPEDGAESGTAEVRDVNGNVLKNGDTVTVVKDLKVRGTSLVVKVGTKVKNIKIVHGDHDIDCKIPGFGPMMLKSEKVKKC
ncbi:MAG: protein PhnA [Planctomycetota bacterium]